MRGESAKKEKEWRAPNVIEDSGSGEISRAFDGIWFFWGVPLRREASHLEQSVAGVVALAARAHLDGAVGAEEVEECSGVVFYG